MKTYFLLLIAVFMVASSVLGQQSSSGTNLEAVEPDPFRLWLVDASFSVSEPLGNFNTKLGGDAFWGVGLSAFYQIAPEKPAFVGLDIRYNCLQRQRSEWIDFLDTGEFADFVGTATSNMVTIDLVYRYFLSVGLWGIEPYVEGRFGSRWMFTFESTTAFIGDFEEFSDASFANNSWALSYGGGAGFQVPLGGTTYLNLKTVYTLGNSAEIDVLDESVAPEDITFPIQGYRLTNTATSTLRFEAGVTFLF